PVEWKKECWAGFEAFVSLGLLAAAFYMFSVWLSPESQLLRNRPYLFGIITLYGFSWGAALSAFRYGKGFGRILGAIMLFIHIYLVYSFQNVREHM
ncbi:MAG: hypothetical protein IT364_14190, partial [Candidatus Hydrogenedentes bacterium]|nr:hypothetical protein [Candidatus Hydrogenedentota bacterium]